MFAPWCEIGPEGRDDLGPQARVVLERRADAGGHAARELGRDHGAPSPAAGATCRSSPPRRRPRRRARARARRAPGAARRAGARGRSRRARVRPRSARPGARRRGAPPPSWRARRRRPRGPGAAPTTRRPPAARARRGTARRWWGRPSPRGRAAGRTARSRRAPAPGVGVGARPAAPPRRRRGARAARAAAAPPPPRARRVAHQGQRDQRGTGVQVAEGFPGRRVARCGGGEPRGSRRQPNAASRPFARGQDRAVRGGWRLPCCRP